MATRSVFTIPDKEKALLRELSRQSKLSEAELVRLMIRHAAKKAGLPDPDTCKTTDNPHRAQAEAVS